ncbi:MAG: ABC transporter substrate-binding protein [Gammaproteobacteria bacterium]|nr:ABC transporter substrate-binding protein [Gammaproteobacteria bacterium]
MTAFLRSAFLSFGLAWVTSSTPLAATLHPLEVPVLAAAVQAGSLAPVEERVPQRPFIVRYGGTEKTAGRHGGELRTLMGKARDIRMLVVYGYARLVGYDEHLAFVPDIVERYEVEDNRVFTFHLRPGHKWSDGYPFTSQDFRYYWEDVANDKDLSPLGPPTVLLVDGQPPEVEIIDETTIRYRWNHPNPNFLPALAGARPLFIYRPAHYLKQFHARYESEGELEEKVAKFATRNWAGLHHRMDEMYRFDNPDLPTLQPWMNTTRPPSERFVFARNPYYHRIDEQGRQLPYIDRVIVNIASSSLVPAKTGAGESDLQGRYLRLDNYTFLKAGEQRHNYAVRLWRTAKGSQIALYPNLNTSDHVWRELLHKSAFRRALSLAVHRHEINQVIYFGLVFESANTVLPQSPLFRPEYQRAWADFDLEKANALLDEIGLTERDSRGIRLLPDGRPAEIIIQSAGESTEESDVLELIHDSWLQVGIKLYTRPSQREVFRNRTFAGDTVMAVWSGLGNAIPTPSMSPEELAPTSQQQLQWPKWGQYYETRQRAGQLPVLDSVRELAEHNAQWRYATTAEAQKRIWHAMLKIHSEEVFTIGTVAGVPQPVVISNRLRNLPPEGTYHWDPGAYFGIYRPDTFWFEK